jgi:hypothetical protein
MAMMIACTVVMSVLAHGVTANRWVSVYRMRAARDVHTDSHRRQ